MQLQLVLSSLFSDKPNLNEPVADREGGIASSREHIFYQNQTILRHFSHFLPSNVKWRSPKEITGSALGKK